MISNFKLFPNVNISGKISFKMCKNKKTPLSWVVDIRHRKNVNFGSYFGSKFVNIAQIWRCIRKATVRVLQVSHQRWMSGIITPVKYQYGYHSWLWHPAFYWALVMRCIMLNLDSNCIYDYGSGNMVNKAGGHQMDSIIQSLNISNTKTCFLRTTSMCVNFYYIYIYFVYLGTFQVCGECYLVDQ